MNNCTVCGRAMMVYRRFRSAANQGPMDRSNQEPASKIHPHVMRVSG
jgi:hypothetical protein